MQRGGGSMPVAQLEHGLGGHAGQLVGAKGNAGLGLGRVQQLRVLCQRGDQAVQDLRHHLHLVTAQHSLCDTKIVPHAVKQLQYLLACKQTLQLQVSLRMYCCTS